MSVAPKALISVKELSMLRKFYQSHKHCKRNVVTSDGGNPTFSQGSIQSGSLSDPNDILEELDTSSSVDPDLNTDSCVAQPNVNLADAPIQFEQQKPIEPGLSKQVLSDTSYKSSPCNHNPAPASSSSKSPLPNSVILG